MNNNDILVIPDGHAHYQHSNDRFDWLGRYILATRPSVVVCIGDLADMPSLSSYDEGTKNAWGRRYKTDCAVTIDAQERIWGPTREWNKQQRKHKNKQYLPRTIFMGGNHEDRADRLANANGWLDEFLDYRSDLKLKQYWTEVYEFKDESNAYGVSFSHYFPNGLLGKPVGGVSIARSMAIKLSRSAVQGHSHVFSYHYTDRGPDKPIIECWACGCYAHNKQIEGWNRNTVAMWRYGLLHLRNVVDGVATDGWSWIEQSYLARTYGS